MPDAPVQCTPIIRPRFSLYRLLLEPSQGPLGIDNALMVALLLILNFALHVRNVGFTPHLLALLMADTRKWKRLTLDAHA
jgi:hypothetical protein